MYILLSFSIFGNNTEIKNNKKFHSNNHLCPKAIHTMLYLNLKLSNNTYCNSWESQVSFINTYANTYLTIIFYYQFNSLLSLYYQFNQFYLEVCLG